MFPESGIKAPVHAMSHHGSIASKIAEYSKLNVYHMSLLPYFLGKLRETPDGDGNLLDHSLILLGTGSCRSCWPDTPRDASRGTCT